MHQSSFFDLSLADLTGRLAEWGEPAYRARQAWANVYRRLVSRYDEMTDLPAGLRSRLAAELPLAMPEALHEVRSDDGLTHKALLRLGDGRTIEAVLMRYERDDDGRARNTVCVSSQVGCAMACGFCATGQGGIERNLTPGEIVGQVVHFARMLRGEEARVSNVVFMGMGEPLANYASVWRAVETLHSAEGLDIGARHITISTVGIIPGIRRLAREALPVTLAVSLHAPDDALRQLLIPTQRRPIAELLQACRDYFKATGRRPSFEYCLIAGVNDSDAQALSLARLLRNAGFPAHVNLIPLNPTPDEAYRRPARARVLSFQRVLADAGINCTVRAEKGVEIAAACGQLRGPRLQGSLDVAL
ncbi:MAG TPA: 23S rRNA (adenine(2503)-C(2))-methyltransferase RlmN, partial [Dehalococcoidia bacterium]|nr:23S rRNA (adenine(2503)-C(2))-methyltransferase RlmN [Dehalococcoidia bacterium]